MGVVADEKNAGLRSDPHPETYLPLECNHMVEDAWLVVRGAAPGDVLRMALHGALVPLTVGVVAGTAGALAGTRYLDSLLFVVKPNDFLTLATAGCVLAAAALLATYIRARRAAGTNPAVTLRSE